MSAVILPVVKGCSREDGAVVLDLQIPPSLVYLEGHFPGYPVLPGVVQLKWVIDYASYYFAVEGSFRQLNVLKFTKVIKPNMDIQLSLAYQKPARQISFTYRAMNVVCSSGRILYG